MDIYEIKFNNGVDYNAYDIERALRKVYKNAPRLSVVPASLALPKVDRDILKAELLARHKIFDDYKESRISQGKLRELLADAIITYLEGRGK